MARKYVYLIRFTHRFEDGSYKDFDYVWRVYSSLRKAQDSLELWKEIYTAELLNAGYDIECDVDHWVNYRENGDCSSLTFKDGCSVKTLQINKEILF